MPKSAKMRLDSTRIRSLNFKIKKDKEDKGESAGPSPKNIPINMKLSYGSNYDYHKKIIFIEIIVSIDQNELPFMLDIEYEGLFVLDKRVPKKQIKPFCEINCPAILFPFLRECIADITRRAGLNPLILPPVNFVELARKKEIPH